MYIIYIIALLIKTASKLFINSNCIDANKVTAIGITIIAVNE